MPKPSAINAVPCSQPKGSPTAVSGSLQRGQSTKETLVDLNFKVPPEFRQKFKRLALDAQLKNIQLLMRAVDSWEKQQGKKDGG